MTDFTRRVFDYSLKTFLIVSTLFYLPVPEAVRGNAYNAIQWGYMIQELFFRYGIVYLFSISLFVKPLREANIKALAIFVIYIMLASVCLGFDIASRRTILNIFFGVLFYKIVVENFDFSQIKSYVTWVFWLLFANLVLCFFQAMKIDPIFQRIDAEMLNFSFGKGEAIGFMKIKAVLGDLAAIAAPFLAVLSPLLVIVTLPLMFYSSASSAVLAFIVSMSVILWFNVRRRWFFAILGALLLAGAMYVFIHDMPSNSSSYDRFKVWFVSIGQVLKVCPFWGFGIGHFSNWNLTTPQETSTILLRWVWAHNEFIQMLYETGIIGLSIICIYIKGMFKHSYIYKKDYQAQCLLGCFVAIIITAFFNFPFHLARLCGIMVFLMALLDAKINTLEKEYEKF